MFLSRRAFIVLAAGATLSACSPGGKIATPEGGTPPGALTQSVILAAINKTRRQHGVAPLTYSTALEDAARTQVNVMASRDTLSHTVGGNLKVRMETAGYRGAVGENLANGHKTLESAIVGWLNSPGHRRTLLSPRFSEFGLAAARARGGKVYWAFLAGGSFEAWLPT